MNNPTQKPAIYITAVGYNSPSGTGIHSFWEKLTANVPSHNEERIEVIDPQQFLGIKGLKFLNKATKLYCNTAFQCIEEASLRDQILESSDRIGLYDSSDLSNIEDGFLFDLTAKVEGPGYVSPMNAPNTIANASSSQMAIKSGIKGPNFTVCSGACSSLQAMDIATLHLKQGIVDYAIVGSTEVVSKYQNAVRNGENRPNTFGSSEVSISLLLQKANNNSDTQPYAKIIDFQAGTQLKNESKEGLLLRLIKQTNQHPYCAEHPIDLIVFGGGYHNADIKKFENHLKSKSFNIPITFPEVKIGSGDNAGGSLGMLCAIGHFTQQLSLLYSKGSNEEIIEVLAPNNIKTALVYTLDKSGYAMAVLISK